MQPEHSQFLMPVVVRPDPVMVRGEGSYLWDDRGRRYLDFVQGWAVNALGHAAPEVRRALAAQAAQLITASPAFYNLPQLELAERLTSLSGLAQAYFCTSGAEANECAIKLARKWGRLHRGGAFEVVSTHDSFHGRTLAAMAASGKPGWEELYPPNLPGFRKVPYGDIGALSAALGPATAAILVEPIQGEAGVIVPPEGYLRKLRTLADEHGVLLIFDEIQTGMARTGTLFAFEQEGVLPDVLTLGKGLGSGMAISAVVASARASCFQPGDQGGTHHGNALAAAVGIAVLDVLSQSTFLASVRARGAELGDGLGAVARRHDAKTRGRGLLRALELVRPVAERVRDACLGMGLLINAARPHTIRLMPSLRVTAREIDEMLRLLDDALSQV
jgi:acetylornithine/N-succinyldiaminopimelate aminotransferase